MPREVIRDAEGNLYDVDGRRKVTVAELAGDVRAGRRFRVRDMESDTVCTQQVLLEVLQLSIPTGIVQTPAPSGVGTALELLRFAIKDRD